MPNPYTLLLHETDHPDRPLTFTLDGDRFSMDLTAAFTPQLPAPGEPPPTALTAWAESLAGKLVQPFQEPMSVKDVTFLVQEDSLTLVLWKRLRGLRLAPVTIALSHIDDPLAAADFADQLRARADQAAHPGRYTGALDYLGTWILIAGAAAGIFTSLGYWLSRHSGASHRST